MVKSSVSVSGRPADTITTKKRWYHKAWNVKGHTTQDCLERQDRKDPKNTQVNVDTVVEEASTDAKTVRDEASARLTRLLCWVMYKSGISAKPLFSLAMVRNELQQLYHEEISQFLKKEKRFRQQNKTDHGANYS